MSISTGRETQPPSGAPRRDHGFHPVRVSRLIQETEDAVSVALRVPEELRASFAYRAGQFVTFRVQIDGQQHLRSYSMSSCPEVDDEFRVTVKRVPEGVVSTWLTSSLAEGDELQSTCPAGVFTLGTGSGDIVGFAGGSGITPIYSLIKSALATTSRPVRLLYANRDAPATIFRSELDALAEQYGDRLEVVHHFDVDQGFVDADEVRSYLANPGTDYYICGPTPFMDLVEATLEAGGVTGDRIHIERFGPVAAPEEASEPPKGTVAASSESPAAKVSQVTIELDGRTETGQHRPGTTILQTARSLGMSPPFSCEAGDCATCMAKLTEGEVTMHANNALFDDEVEGGWILTCQAVPTTPTVHVIYGYEED
jgi:3-ketosteroid 9alpha-monooxygenase subunit B